MNRPGGDPDALADLVRRAQRGDREAVACLVQRYQAALARFCHRLAGAAGPDLTQETLLRAVQAIERLKAPERFPAWLFGIAANLARKGWQRRPQWPLSLERLAEAYPDVPWRTSPLWGDGAAAGGAPEAAAERAEAARQVAAAVAALPAALRRVLVLHYLDGLSYAEIAAALDVPVTTVKGRLFKSRARLRRALAEQRPSTRRTRRRVTIRPREETAMRSETAPADDRLVAVDVESVRLSGYVPKSSRVIVLKERDGERRLAIVVGVPEGEALALHLQGHPAPRPLSHDLMRALVEAGRMRLERAAVSRLEREGHLFFATLTLRRPRGRAGEVVEVDARPSDAINLALRAGAPLFVAETVLDQAGLPSAEAAPPPPGEEGSPGGAGETP